MNIRNCIYLTRWLESWPGTGIPSLLEFLIGIGNFICFSMRTRTWNMARLRVYSMSLSRAFVISSVNKEELLTLFRLINQISYPQTQMHVLIITLSIVSMWMFDYKMQRWLREQINKLMIQYQVKDLCLRCPDPLFIQSMREDRFLVNIDACLK